MSETVNGRTVEQRVRSVLEQRSEVAFAYLFGSRASGRTHGASDVDVAVYLREDHAGREREPDGQGGDAGRSGAGERARSASRAGSGGWSGELAAWSEIHGDLVTALASAVSAGGASEGGHAPEGVDLVVLNDAPPLLADRVLRSGKLVLSRSEAERIRWAVRTKSRYCDLRPLRRRLDDVVSERLRTGRFGRRGSPRQIDTNRASGEQRSDVMTDEDRP